MFSMLKLQAVDFIEKDATEIRTAIGLHCAADYETLNASLTNIITPLPDTDITDFVADEGIVIYALGITWLLGYWKDDRLGCIKTVLKQTPLVTKLEQNAYLYTGPELLTFTHNSLTIRRLYAGLHSLTVVTDLVKNYKTTHMVHEIWEEYDGLLQGTSTQEHIHGLREILYGYTVDVLGYISHVMTTNLDLLEINPGFGETGGAYHDRARLTLLHHV